MTNISETTKMIYDRLQDNESRMVFNHRLMFFLDRNPYHLFDMISETVQIEKKLFPVRMHQCDLIENIRQSGKTVVLVLGKDVHNLRIINYLKYLGIDICLYYPIEGTVQDPIKKNFVLVNSEELNTTYKNAVFLCLPRLADRAKQLCEKHSANPDNIFALNSMSYRQQYFGLEFIIPEKNEVFVDAGAYIGDTVEPFIQWASRGYGKIFSFECDPDNCEKMQANLSEKNIRDVELIRKGVWSEETVLRFQANGSFGSTISTGGNIEVPVTSIDSVVGDERVTFIKMDIEGAELEALKGARNCIAKHSPKLAICVYHKPEDILTIPETILDINPEYSFYLRHHCLAKPTETVLYAIIKK